ncbi:hypothetical protein GQ457_13G006290 [Hibiscus cannabinus]
MILALGFSSEISGVGSSSSTSLQRWVTVETRDSPLSAAMVEADFCLERLSFALWCQNFRPLATLSVNIALLMLELICKSNLFTVHIRTQMQVSDSDTRLVIIRSYRFSCGASYIKFSNEEINSGFELEI